MIVALGGVIAFFADRLGRVLGKKRLTLFGMRPRYTATLITIVSGILIPVVTVAIVMAVSSDVRQWLQEGQNAIREAETKRSEVRALTFERDRRIQENEALDRQNRALSEQLRATRGQLEELKKRAAGFEKQAAEAQRRMASLNRQVAQLIVKVGATENDLRERTAELKETERKKEETQRSYDQLNQEIKDSYEENIRLQRDNERLLGDATRLQRSVEGLEREKTSREAEVAAMTEKSEKLAGELSQAQGSLDRTLQDLRKMEQELLDLIPISTSSRLHPLMYGRGDEVARLAVPAELTAQQARMELSRLLRAARIEAEKRGAKGTRNIPSAGLMTRIVEGESLSTEEQERRLVERLGGLGEPLVLVATATVNTFEGEPVALDVKWFRNPQVFRQGELVAETRVDGTAPFSAILSQFTAFLHDKVRERARQVGMVPLQGRDESFGTVTNDEILEVVRQVREEGRLARLQAFAEVDTRAGDTLHLVFRVR